ncbi:condensation domain-containing protein, partial [Acinetobacter sp. NS4_7]
LDLNKLHRAFLLLGERHQCLRAFISLESGEPAQVFSDTLNLELRHMTVDDANLQIALERAVEPFDLSHGPLVRALLLRTRTR